MDKLTLVRTTCMLLVVLAALFLVGLVMSYAPSSDLPAFLRAADRVAHGVTPYGDAGELHRYLYAPWLAWLMVPLTWVPFDVARLLWHALLAAAFGVALWPLVRFQQLEGYLAAMLIGAFGFHSVWSGHPQMLMVALLVWGLPTKWGPVSIGIAASLKITPIILVVYYVGRREWSKALLSVTVASVLWAPALLYDLSDWGQMVGTTLSLLSISPILWAAVGLGALGTAYKLAPTRYGWLAALVAWIALMPRLLLYDISALTVARTPRS